MAKKWYLGVVEKPLPNADTILEKTVDFKKKLEEDKYEWSTGGRPTLDPSLLKITYFSHKEVPYQTWVYDRAINQLEPKQGRYITALGLSFLLKIGEKLLVIFPYHLNDIPITIGEVKEYVAKTSNLIFEDPSVIKILKYDVSLLNISYKSNLKGMGFTSRLGGVKSGIIYGENMDGDMLYEEARKGKESYSIFEFELLNKKFKVGISAGGAIVTFNKIEGFEFEFFKALHNYLAISKEFY